jgi:hypothetical protein
MKWKYVLAYLLVWSSLGMSYPFWYKPLSGCSGNDYGAPAGNGGDGVATNVSAHFLFEESSGSIVDYVGGLEIPPVGTPTYGDTVSGLYECLSPGAGGSFIADSNSYFYLEDAGEVFPSLGFGTYDFTLELWFSSVSELSFEPINGKGLSFPDLDGYNVSITQSTNTLSFTIIYVSTNYVFKWTIPDGVTDGDPHKVRISGERVSGDITCELDGDILAESGTQSDLSALVGADLKVRDRVWIGGEPNPPFGPPRDLSSRLYELRVSRNATNNSGYVTE